MKATWSTTVVLLLASGLPCWAQYGAGPVVSVTTPVGARPAPALLSPGKAVTLALSDADAQAIEDAPFYRYLYLPALPDEVAEFELAQRLHVNLLSREATLAYPTRVAVGLWRIDFRDYQWSRDVWEKLAVIDPYFHRQQTVISETDAVVEVEVDERVETPYGHYDAAGRFQVTEYRVETKKVKKKERRPGKRTQTTRSILYAPQAAGQLASLAALTQSQAPIVRADWFLAQTARQIDLHNREDTGTGYFDFLGLRSRNDYFRLIGFRQRDADRRGNEIRAVVGDSGVSAQDRQVVHDGDAHWTTLEVFDQAGRGVAINNLRRGEFDHVAERHYGPLPNGLPVVYLSNNLGVQQSSVPDKIGGNRSTLNTSNDLRVHPIISCIQCHTDVLKLVEDEVRPVYTGRLNVLSNDKLVALELRRAYGANLTRILNKDRQDFQDIYTLPTGKSSVETSALYSRAFTNYAVRRVDLTTAARELGVQPLALRKALDDAASRLGRGDFRLDPFLFGAVGTEAGPRPISRLTFEDSYQDLQDILYGTLKNP